MGSGGTFENLSGLVSDYTGDSMFRQTVWTRVSLINQTLGIPTRGVKREALLAGGSAIEPAAKEPGAGDGLPEPVAAALQVARARAAA